MAALIKNSFILLLKTKRCPRQSTGKNVAGKETAAKEKNLQTNGGSEKSHQLNSALFQPEAASPVYSYGSSSRDQWAHFHIKDTNCRGS